MIQVEAAAWKGRGTSVGSVCVWELLKSWSPFLEFMKQRESLCGDGNARHFLMAATGGGAPPPFLGPHLQSICMSSRTQCPLLVSGLHGALEEQTQAFYKLPFHPHCLGTTRREVYQDRTRSNSRGVSESSPPEDESLFRCSARGRRDLFPARAKPRNSPLILGTDANSALNKNPFVIVVLQSCSSGQEESRPL